jgi:dolichol-phosphate mannosyltransferase
MVETPIVFADRERGQSKINRQEALSALWIIFRLGLKNWLGV